MSTTRMLIAAMCLLIGALGFVACGGGGDDDDDNDAANATQQTQDQSGDDADDPTDEPDVTAEPEDPTDAPSDGGNGGGGGGLDATEACSVITQSEVEAAFGGISMLDPEYIPLPDVPVFSGSTAKVASCSYVSTEATDSLSLTLYSADETGAEGLVDLACTNKDSAGIGDKSCWYSEARTEIQMQVGPNFIDLFVTTVDGDSEAILTTLAETAAGRLD